MKILCILRTLLSLHRSEYRPMYCCRLDYYNEDSAFILFPKQACFLFLAHQASVVLTVTLRIMPCHSLPLSASFRVPFPVTTLTRNLLLREIDARSPSTGNRMHYRGIFLVGRRVHPHEGLEIPW